MTGVFARLGRSVAHHPRLTVLVWVVIAAAGYSLAVFGVHGESLFDRLTSGAPGVPGSESERAQTILEGTGVRPSSLTLVLQGVDPADAEVASAFAPAREDLAAIDGVASVID